MIYRLILVFFLFFTQNLTSQNYPAEIINHDIICEVDENNILTVTKRLLLKINSPSGRDYADFQLYYDSKSSINNIDCRILNSQYDLIKTFKKKEISDYSALSGYFHTDDRYKEIKAYHNTYPYMIELRYKQIFDEFFSLPTWYPQNEENIPSKKSTYKLIVPDNYEFHYKFYNFSPEEDIQTSESIKTYTWKSENISPLYAHESYLPPIKTIYPTARFIPDNFIFGGIEGASTSWSEIGKWQSKLISGLDKLPETEIEKVKDLTKLAESQFDKVKLIYEYLQNETRYIGVFIGIGGWKPFDASYVCNNKYGDCKALTNYMMSMLKVIDIKSYYSLIIAGEDEPDIDTSFPGKYFNHVVLYVLLENDTLWLECTSQNIPFGYWGTFTSGKHALVCDFENSFITPTPKFDHGKNVINQLSTVNIIDGKLSVQMERELFGEPFEEVLFNLSYSAEKSIGNKATNILPFQSFELTGVKYDTIIFNGCTGYKESLHLIFSNNIQEYGSNMIVSPFNAFFETKYPLSAERYNPISILHNFRIADTIQFNIPQGYVLEVLPDDFQSITKFGKYKSQYRLKKNKLFILKTAELNQGIYPIADYHEFKLFINNIIRNEKQKILIKKL